MQKYVSSNQPLVCPAEIRAALGPAPVLTEKARLQHEFQFRAFAGLLKPRDFVEWQFVRDCADIRSELLWLKKLNIHLVQAPVKNLMAQRCHEISAGINAKIEPLRQKHAVELALKIAELKGAPDHIKAEADRLRAEGDRDLELEIEDVKLERHKKFLEQEWPILQSDITDADTFALWSGPYEWVCKRIAVLNKEFANTLEQFDQWRHGGLGERLVKAANEIIEGEYNEEFDSPFVEQAEAEKTDVDETAPMSSPRNKAFSGRL